MGSSDDFIGALIMAVLLFPLAPLILLHWYNQRQLWKGVKIYSYDAWGRPCDENGVHY